MAHLTNGRLARFRTRLLELRSEQEAELRRRRAAMNQIDRTVGDTVDEIQDREHIEELSRSIDSSIGVLRDVADALGRIDIGTYGVCMECGAAIPDARIKNNPLATCCLRCQEAIEALAVPGSLCWSISPAPPYRRLPAK